MECENVKMYMRFGLSRAGVDGIATQQRRCRNRAVVVEETVLLAAVSDQLNDTHHNKKPDGEHLNGRKNQGGICQRARGCASAREQSIPESKRSGGACDARTEHLQWVASTEDRGERDPRDGQ